MRLDWVTIYGAVSLVSMASAIGLAWPTVKALNHGDDDKGLPLAALSLLLVLFAIVVGDIGIAHMADPVDLWPDSATDLIPPPMPASQPTPVVRA
ncbi:MAG: hypothetical protein UY26_C0001G0031 [Candidatus Jorgensenbacteria bacterium GW2011_GWA1_48_13]|uniref:Uncharacterized protein n=2 Tax=Candidatus Joergenseniibacteriota TaxID=1752739 RepID=A0A0G1YJU9_9BACT|nr:MAG: hypothetical protein UY26_C0001G0031 [Candidatus Jorgensenbacteria bacterium GW2011_GWA1_48_13]KKU99392.1 MAG: hypothetical protein UY32_C0001G0027 [Candidatus Jorgensenbacteria bacterium GW2011_GWC1_48_8]KKW15277.1 MAG: hypothetical protein UY55_C0001G0031 [Candidatus Jorgensenbacteria bacterium GW2011_GWB1_50_10]